MICRLFGHVTKLVTDGDEGQIRCTRCAAVLKRWKVIRPERANQAAREIARAAAAKAALFAEREARARQMGLPEPSTKVVRMRGVV